MPSMEVIDVIVTTTTPTTTTVDDNHDHNHNQDMNPNTTTTTTTTTTTSATTTNNNNSSSSTSSSGGGTTKSITTTASNKKTTTTNTTNTTTTNNNNNKTLSSKSKDGRRRQSTLASFFCSSSSSSNTLGVKANNMNNHKRSTTTPKKPHPATSSSLTTTATAAAAAAASSINTINNKKKRDSLKNIVIGTIVVGSCSTKKSLSSSSSPITGQLPTNTNHSIDISTNSSSIDHGADTIAAQTMTALDHQPTTEREREQPILIIPTTSTTNTTTVTAKKDSPLSSSSSSNINPNQPQPQQSNRIVVDTNNSNDDHDDDDDDDDDTVAVSIKRTKKKRTKRITLTTTDTNTNTNTSTTTTTTTTATTKNRVSMSPLPQNLVARHNSSLMIDDDDDDDVTTNTILTGTMIACTSSSSNPSPDTLATIMDDQQRSTVLLSMNHAAAAAAVNDDHDADHDGDECRVEDAMDVSTIDDHDDVVLATTIADTTTVINNHQPTTTTTGSTDIHCDTTTGSHSLILPSSSTSGKPNQDVVVPPGTGTSNSSGHGAPTVSSFQEMDEEKDNSNTTGKKHDPLIDSTMTEPQSGPSANSSSLLHLDMEFEKIQSVRTTYQQRIYDTIMRCCGQNYGLPEEKILQSSLQEYIIGQPNKNGNAIVVPVGTVGPAVSSNVVIDSATKTTTVTRTDTNTLTSFPDYAIQTLVHIVEGQSMPMNQLSTIATNVLNSQYGTASVTTTTTTTSTTTSTTRDMMDVYDSSENIDTATATSQQSLPAIVVFTEEIVSAKLQLLATRNHMLQSTVTSITKASSKKIWNKDEITAATIMSLLEQDRMYRWEIVTPSDSLMVFFPDATCRTNVKKARAARKKISTYCTTLIKMMLLLADIESQMTPQQHPSGTANASSGNEVLYAKLWSRFHTEEEKIFKMDREYEVNRIAEIARIEKQEMDRKQKELQQQRKVEAALMRQKEKEMKQQQLLQSKADAAQQQKIAKAAATLAKKMTVSNNESKKDKRDEQKSAGTSKDVNVKQKQCMMSFLSKRASSATAIVPTESLSVPNHNTHTNEQQPPNSNGSKLLSHLVVGGKSDDNDGRQKQLPSLSVCDNPPSDLTKILSYGPVPKHFDFDTFRNNLTATSGGSSVSLTDAFVKTHRTDGSKHNRQRRGRIRVPVFVTVYPPNDCQYDNPFMLQHQQPYAEQVHISIRNRYKFLSFYEDVRPPYYGTWSKESKLITGKNPFSVDTSHLDYEIDSEGEWEEEEDEIGEEIGDDAMEDDEEKELDEDDDDEDDGWLAADDEIDDDDDDDGEVALGLDKKTNMAHKTKAGSSSKREASPVCVISPYQGRPLLHHDIKTPTGKDRIDGIRLSDAINFLKSFVTVQCNDTVHCLDAFPPPLIDEFDASSDQQLAEKSQAISEECMKTFAKFVHRCTFGSKDKVIDELLLAHPSVTNTRAQAYRVLDTIAEKKKHPCDGSYFWEVKIDVLNNLGLTDLAKCTEVEDMKQEAMKVIVRCVHNSTLASKEKIVDEIRSNHEHVTASRAEAMRIVQSIATKAKHPNGGYYWIVKEEIRMELGVDSLPNITPATGFSKVHDETNVDVHQTLQVGIIRKKRKPTPLISSDENVPNTTVKSTLNSEPECAQKEDGKPTVVNMLLSRKKCKIL